MWLDALSLQNQWAAILETLDQPANPLPKHLQALYKARSLAALDRSPESTAAYELAYRESQEKTEDFLETLAYLALAGQAQLFETGLQKNLADPALAEPTLRTLIPAVSRQRDAAKTKRVYDLAAGVPSLADNPALQNDRDYLALLLGQPVDHEKISTRTEANPRAGRKGHRRPAFRAVGFLQAGGLCEAVLMRSRGNSSVQSAPASTRPLLFSKLRQLRPFLFHFFSFSGRSSV